MNAEAGAPTGQWMPPLHPAPLTERPTYQARPLAASLTVGRAHICPHLHARETCRSYQINHQDVAARPARRRFACESSRSTDPAKPMPTVRTRGPIQVAADAAAAVGTTPADEYSAIPPALRIKVERDHGSRTATSAVQPHQAPAFAPHKTLMGPLGGPSVGSRESVDLPRSVGRYTGTPSAPWSSRGPIPGARRLTLSAPSLPGLPGRAQ